MTCRLVEHTVSRLALDGSDTVGSPFIEKHLAACASCRQAALDLRALAGRLPSVVPVPAPDESLAGRIVRAIGGTRTRDHALGWAGWVPAAWLVCAAAFLVWIAVGLRNQLVESGITSPVVQRAAPAVKNDRTLAVATSDSGQQVSRALVLGQGSELEPKLRGHTPRHRGLTTGQRQPQTPKHDKGLVVQNSQGDKGGRLSWTSWGYYLESSGDYARASDAYALAYKEKADPALAYAAGRAAETAGDISRALDYYTTILSSPPSDQRQ